MGEPNLLLSPDELHAWHGKKWHEYEPDVLPAWIADMDFTPAEPIRRALETMVVRGDFCYSRTDDEQRLATAFTDRMATLYGWRARPELVIPVADLVQALTATVLAYSEADDGIATLTPAYPPLLGSITNTGRHIVDVPLRPREGRYVLDPAELETALAPSATKMLLLCHPHNPTGRVFPEEELRTIARIAERTGTLVVTDEVHSDLVYPGSRFAPLASVGGNPVITLQSATKSFNLGGLRCGVIHFGSSELRDVFRRVHPERLLGRVNKYGVEATVAAWEYGAPWLEQVLELLRHNRDKIQTWAASTPGIELRALEGTYFAWLDCSEIPGNPHELFLHDGRVALSPGADFGEGSERFVRLNFATSATILENILARMYEAISIARN